MLTDEGLRTRALEELGPFGDELAREALETGVLEVEGGVASWEASHGTVRGCRVVLTMAPELHAHIAATPAARDELTRAVAAAVVSSEPSGRASLYDLVLLASSDPRPKPLGPFR